MRHLTFRFLLLLGVLAASTPVRAQSLVPPVRTFTDSNGIDHVSGMAQVSYPGPSVGSNGSSLGLELSLWGGGYTGQQWLPELGMSSYKARIYSPTLGRFMQTDPIGYSDGINWYAYVGNDPMNRTDPSGLESPCVTLNNCGRAIQTPQDAKNAAITLGAMATALTAGIAYETIVLAAPMAEIATIDGEPGPTGASRIAGGTVRAYESGAASDLKAASRVGDGLDIHHAPQAHVAEQVSPGYSRAQGPAMALPKAEHQAMPTVTGLVSMSQRSMLAHETKNLRNFSNATNQNIQEWLKTAKEYFGIK